MTGSRRCLLGAAIGVVFALLGAQVAQAAAPSVSTGAPTGVSYVTATLNGVINPHGTDTSYYFQYGPNKAYGSQTALADAGAGTSAVKVSLPVSGLSPFSVYHYRLVALSSAGAATGADRSFKTARVPLSVGILAAPNPVPYGGTATIQGTVSGTGNAGIAVVLQSNPFPYTQGFLNLGNAELTNAAGGFSFPVTGLMQATQFRVITATKSVVVSPVVIEGVAVNVTAHVHRTHRRHRVRIYGTVTPAESGMEVAIMRVLHGRNILVAGTILHHHSTTSSVYSHVVRIVPGVYRVLVKVTDGAHSSAYSEPMRIR
ncbi:MAG: hypothetical protein ACRDK2_09255 [Solirubrobacteraceae bacterium]